MERCFRCGKEMRLDDIPPICPECAKELGELKKKQVQREQRGADPPVKKDGTSTK